MTPAVEAHIDLAALRHNLDRVRGAAPGRRIMAIIKANAYGHGMSRVAECLNDVDAFAVARLEEALQLRQAGISTPIVLLEGFLEANELSDITANHLQIVIHHEYQVQVLERTRSAKPVIAWLKIDTGMHRLGVRIEQAADLWQRLQRCSAVGELRVMTHLASADDRSCEQTEQQLDTFRQAIGGMEGAISIANSAGILGWPRSHGDWVRPGIMLYGVSPFMAGKGEEEGLQPVMTLRSRLIAINQARKGDAVGYGASWVCPEDMWVGVVACGYGDGYPRHAVPGTPVLVNNVRVPLIGRVSMDMICVDLRQQPRADVGDPVVLWGKGLPVEEVALRASTIPYELLCGVTGRVFFNDRS